MYRNLLKKLATSLAALATGAGVAFMACSCKTKPKVEKEENLQTSQTNVVKQKVEKLQQAEVKEEQLLN